VGNSGLIHSAKAQHKAHLSRHSLSTPTPTPPPTLTKSSSTTVTTTAAPAAVVSLLPFPLLSNASIMTLRGWLCACRDDGDSKQGFFVERG